ncbi:hypothetical protein TRP8649_03468 [Pelagimonas phthalicica]|uniref:Oxidoreductase molybdopterin-binding domain-containing protein n=1 Tax=Pelagimonas phthalicica TaxID=1037362 RepID=A0A238JFZ4_9RHOB|nr:oxidoreductase [Pelagimonas phthalicica]TDS92274.1 hypothetical protein CLV87_3465 [Pelagimonas phthalicica]SMX29335.1 hypothetical protein TRP8649_03468 [Pelagimonas phthalicica]
MQRSFLVASGVFLLAGAPLASDQQAATPVLTVETQASSIDYDLVALRDLPQTSFETSTIWTTGVKAFTGVALLALLDEMEIKSGTVRARAANDYAVDIPVASLSADAPIVAWQMDDALMSRRGKGPLWIVFPYDRSPEFRTETVYSQSVWQLQSLHVLHE